MSETRTAETFHCINDHATTVDEALLGLCESRPSLLSYSPKHKIVYRRDLPTFRTDHVTTIACCGGGHEPMFSGFVGPSFLSAFVSGAVFASPTAAQMLAAIKLCHTPQSSRGTLLLVGNYTGDVLNAGLAITRAAAAGITNVRFVPVGDDVAVGRAKGGKVGRRGLSGHLIALKLACAIAENGGSLEEVVAETERVARNVGTIAVAFDRVALPTALVTELPLLPADTVELGMGAHGEPGLERINPVPELGALVEKMVRLVADTSDRDRGFVPFERGDRVALLVNSLGATEDAVLGVFAERAVKELKGNWGLEVVRFTLGPLVTSLKMSGVGLTIWRIEGGEEGDKQLELWDQRVSCTAWRQ